MTKKHTQKLNNFIFQFQPIYPFFFGFNLDNAMPSPLNQSYRPYSQIPPGYSPAGYQQASSIYDHQTAQPRLSPMPPTSQTPDRLDRLGGSLHQQQSNSALNNSTNNQQLASPGSSVNQTQSLNKTSVLPPSLMPPTGSNSLAQLEQMVMPHLSQPPPPQTKQQQQQQQQPPQQQTNSTSSPSYPSSYPFGLPPNLNTSLNNSNNLSMSAQQTNNSYLSPYYTQPQYGDTTSNSLNNSQSIGTSNNNLMWPPTLNSTNTLSSSAGGSISKPNTHSPSMQNASAATFSPGLNKQQQPPGLISKPIATYNLFDNQYSSPGLVDSSATNVYSQQQPNLSSQTGADLLTVNNNNNNSDTNQKQSQTNSTSISNLTNLNNKQPVVESQLKNESSVYYDKMINQSQPPPRVAGSYLNQDPNYLTQQSTDSNYLNQPPSSLYPPQQTQSIYSPAPQQTYPNFQQQQSTTQQTAQTNNETASSASSPYEMGISNNQQSTALNDSTTANMSMYDQSFNQSDFNNISNNNTSEPYDPYDDNGFANEPALQTTTSGKKKNKGRPKKDTNAEQKKEKKPRAPRTPKANKNNKSTSQSISKTSALSPVNTSMTALDQTGGQFHINSPTCYQSTAQSDLYMQPPPLNLDQQMPTSNQAQPPIMHQAATSQFTSLTASSNEQPPPPPSQMFANHNNLIDNNNLLQSVPPLLTNNIQQSYENSRQDPNLILHNQPPLPPTPQQLTSPINSQQQPVLNLNQENSTLMTTPQQITENGTHLDPLGSQSLDGNLNSNEQPPSINDTFHKQQDSFSKNQISNQIPPFQVQQHPIEHMTTNNFIPFSAAAGNEDVQQQQMMPQPGLADCSYIPQTDSVNDSSIVDETTTVVKKPKAKRSKKPKKKKGEQQSLDTSTELTEAQPEDANAQSDQTLDGTTANLENGEPNEVKPKPKRAKRPRKPRKEKKATAATIEGAELSDQNATLDVTLQTDADGETTAMNIDLDKTGDQTLDLDDVTQEDGDQTGDGSGKKKATKKSSSKPKRPKLKEGGGGKKKRLPKLALKFVNKKKRKRLGSSDGSDIERTPPSSPKEEEDNSNKRRSARLTRKMKYHEEIDLGLSDDDDKKESQTDAVQVTKVIEDTMVVEKIMLSRMGTREIEQDENDEQKLNENDKPPTVDVEEFYVKYKNLSYLHCEWRTEEELEKCDKRVGQKLKRYKQKRDSMFSFDFQEDEPFNPDYCEVDRILDFAEFEEQIPEDEDEPEKKTESQSDAIAEPVVNKEEVEVKVAEGEQKEDKETSDESSNVKIESTSNELIDDKVDVKIEDKIDDKVEDKIDDKTDDKVDEKTDDKIAEKTDDNVDEKMDEKVDEKIDDDDKKADEDEKVDKVDKDLNKDEQKSTTEENMEVDDKVEQQNLEVEKSSDVNDEDVNKVEEEIKQDQTIDENKETEQTKDDESKDEASSDLKEDKKETVEDQPELTKKEEEKPKKMKTRKIRHFLVKWKGLSYEESTWELEDDLDPVKVADFFRYRIIPPKDKWKLKKKPKPADFKKKLESPVYKNGNKLREYQLEGINWLTFCWYNNSHCVLADEMVSTGSRLPVAFPFF